MKKIFRFILIVILCIFLIGMGTGFIDYYRMINGSLPIFNISSYNSQKRIQVFQGMLYKASRKVRASDKESFDDSSNYKFKLITFNLFIPEQKKVENEEYNFIVRKDSDCESKLYYADLDKKVYTYCLNSIMLNNKELLSYLEKDKNIINNIEDNINYTGVYDNKRTLMFKDNNIKIYHCKNNNIYIGFKNMEFQEDFCIEKDDDLKFIFEIKEETNNVELKEEKEIFYEDTDYTYSFDKVKSDYIYITTPKERGNKRIKLKEVLNNKLLSIEDLEKKGLSFTKESKNKE